MQLLFLLLLLSLVVGSVAVVVDGVAVADGVAVVVAVAVEKNVSHTRSHQVFFLGLQFRLFFILDCLFCSRHPEVKENLNWKLTLGDFFDPIVRSALRKKTWFP